MQPVCTRLIGSNYRRSTKDTYCSRISTHNGRPPLKVALTTSSSIPEQDIRMLVGFAPDNFPTPWSSCFSLTNRIYKDWSRLLLIFAQRQHPPDASLSSYTSSPLTYPTWTMKRISYSADLSAPKNCYRISKMKL